MNPRAYQTAAIDAVRAHMRAGRRSVCLCMPTGAGKTVVFSLITLSAVARKSQVLLLAHRRELIDQTSRKLDVLGVDHGVIMADHPRSRPFASVQVASVATLTRRLGLDERDSRAVRIKPDLVFVDEAHHARAESYQTILDAFPSAVVVGLTATPVRLDGRGLGTLFEKLVVGATVRELTEAGYLVPAKGFTYEIPDLSAVRKQAGDYNLAQLDEAMGKVLLGGDLVREWQEHAAGRRTVIFAVNVRHSKLLIEQFQAAGVAAEHVDDATPTAQRDGILQRLGNGETLVVSNVGILTEGWDMPACEVAILARPTKSTALALQMAGRVLRPWCFDCADAPGAACAGHRLKTHARIHDHAGVILEHGLPEQDRKWSLDGDRAAGAPPVRRCPECFLVVALGATTCPECGHVFASDADTSTERTVSQVQAAKIDLDAMRAELAGLQSKRAQQGLPELPLLALAKVARATPQEKAAEYLRLQLVASVRGLKQGWVGYRYRDLFGAWPNFTDEFLASVQPAEREFVRVPRAPYGAAQKRGAA